MKMVRSALRTGRLYPPPFPPQEMFLVELVRNLMAHPDAREGKWRGNWVASTVTPPPNVVYPALLKLMRTPRLPAIDRNDTPTDLNGLVRLGERRNVVSARVPSRSARGILISVTGWTHLRRLHKSCLIRFEVKLHFFQNMYFRHTHKLRL